MSLVVAALALPSWNWFLVKIDGFPGVVNQGVLQVCYESSKDDETCFRCA